MSSIGCPLIGDGMYRHPLYGVQQAGVQQESGPMLPDGETPGAGLPGVQLPPEEAAQLAGIAELDAAIPRQALHAVRLSFRHPVTHTELVFDAPLPPDMALLQEKLRQAASGQ
jgi:23S rRNA pseudouridine1911/1915/1917 synthase